MNRFLLISFVALALTACSNDGDSHSPVTPPQPTLDRPIADAGHNMTLQQGATVVLNASGSHDPEGRPISYLWSLVAKPSASQSALSDPTSPFPSFYLDAVGDYTFELVVNNGEADSLPAQVTVSDSSSVPVADAGPDQRWNAGDTITLDGSHSHDSDGDTLSYSWTITSAPVGSSAILNRADSAYPVITPDVSGDYVFELIVSDGTSSSAADTVTISDTNLKPVANAGADRNFVPGQAVQLDGSKSSDPDGDMLTYQWGIASAPSTSSATISNSDQVDAQFTPDVLGDYVLTLTVNDGMVDSDADSISLRASGHPPVANAGLDIAAVVGQPAQLDGTGSTDVDGDSLTPMWSITSKPRNSTAQLTDIHTMHPVLTPDLDGDYVVALTVFDGSQTSAVDSVTVSTRNLAPVANAGNAFNLAVGRVAHLDGSKSSDPEGQALSYQWSILTTPAGSSAALTSTSVVAPDFTPDVAGTYTFQLIVSDGSRKSKPSTVSVSTSTATVSAAQLTSNAGADQSVATGSLVQLDGSLSSSAQNGALMYEWSFSSKPTGSSAQITNATQVLASFTADVVGDFVVQLKVTDASGQQALDTMVVRDRARNTMPVADAGADLQVDLGVNVVLDGTASMDADGDSLAYTWAMLSRPSGSSAQLNDSNTASPNFTPDVEGDFVFQLVVSDGIATSLPDVVMVHDTERNLAPTARISVGGTLNTAQTIALDGSSSSDPNGDALTYQWSLVAPSGSSATLSSSSAASPTFTADTSGDFVVSLKVSDGSLSSSVVSQTVTIVDPPPGAAITLPPGHNLMFLSSEGGDSRTGALYGVQESNLANVTELTSFHGLPGVSYSFTEQGPVTSPISDDVYILLNGGGVFSTAAIVRITPSTGDSEVFTSIPRFNVSGNEVREFRKPLLFHPDGLSAYTYTLKGGKDGSGVLIHIDFDPSSPTYREATVVAEVGAMSANFLGSQVPLQTDLRWSGQNKLMGLFGSNPIGFLRRSALEFTASDPNDLSQPWTTAAVGGGADVWSRGRTFYYHNDTIVAINGPEPPLVDSVGRDGFGGGTEISDCANPFGLFEFNTTDVYALCEKQQNNSNPILYLTNRAGAFPTPVRSFSGLRSVDIVGVEVSNQRSKLYFTLNDNQALTYINTSVTPPSSVPFTLSQLVEVSLPNYSTRTLVTGNGGDIGDFFVGNVAIVDNPMDAVNDRYINLLSYNGGDIGNGALITLDQLDGSIKTTSLGFERGGYPFGRITTLSNGKYVFSVASIGAQVRTGTTVIYDSSVGTLTPLTTLPRFFRSGLGLHQTSNGHLVGLGVNERNGRYTVYELDGASGAYRSIKEIEPTRDLYPQYEVAIDSDNIWATTSSSLYCINSNGADGQLDYTPSGGVRAITFNGAGAEGYVPMRSDGSGMNQGAILRVSNNCQLPSGTRVVSGLVDIPSTALVLASDGFMYYGTENGKLMQFDTNLNSVTEVASFANTEIAGFLIEDSNGDIVGVARSTNGSADKIFAYTLAGGASTTQDVPEDRPLDPTYPGFTEIN